MIFRVIQVGPIDTNCYLLGDEGACVVVDPGADAQQVLAMVDDTGLALQAILLTHGHWDHVGGVDGILERYPQLPVYIHEKELLSPGGDSHYQYPGAGENQRTYGDGDTIPLGSGSIAVLHTPGHSAGSVTLLYGDTMVAGDTLFAGSCGRCDLPGGDMGAMFVSLKRLGELEGDYKVYSGHGPSSTLDQERRTNPYLKQAMRR